MNELLLIDIPLNDPKENLEIESRMKDLYRSNRIILRFWINSPCLILGRFQRVEYEVSDYARDTMVPVFRRMSGGGTVYHDLGNLNISIVAPKALLQSLGFQGGSSACSVILTRALKSLGFDIFHDQKRNALYIGDQKIMGSAASIHGDIYHFHCSLLVHTDLMELEKTIEQRPQYKKDDRAFVMSVRSPVTNLAAVLPEITIAKVKDSVLAEIGHSFDLSSDKKIASERELSNFSN